MIQFPIRSMWVNVSGPGVKVGDPITLCGWRTDARWWQFWRPKRETLIGVVRERRDATVRVDIFEIEPCR